VPTAGKVCAEYIWIGGTEQDLRCKTRVLSKAPKSVEDLPKWNYDGSSCDQAPGACPHRCTPPWRHAPFLDHHHLNGPDNLSCECPCECEQSTSASSSALLHPLLQATTPRCSSSRA